MIRDTNNTRRAMHCIRHDFLFDSLAATRLMHCVPATLDSVPFT